MPNGLRYGGWHGGGAEGCELYERRAGVADPATAGAAGDVRVRARAGDRGGDGGRDRPRGGGRLCAAALDGEAGAAEVAADGEGRAQPVVLPADGGGAGAVGGDDGPVAADLRGDRNGDRRWRCDRETRLRRCGVG